VLRRRKAMGLTVQSVTDGSLGVSSASDRARITREDFLKLLIAELSHQDPLNPLSNQDFVEQLCTLQNLEAISALTDMLYGMMKAQHMGAASELIGHVIRGGTESGDLVEGVVQRVIIEGRDVFLVVQGQRVNVEDVTEILS
jgi:flagellar basal-body rod modification protein FlgD